MALVWRLLYNGDVWGWAACAFFSPTADESTPRKHFVSSLLHHSFNKKQNCINNFTYSNYATLDTPNLSKLFESAQPTTKHVHNCITVSIIPQIQLMELLILIIPEQNLNWNYRD